MDDITNKYEFQRILQQAAQFRVLRRVFDSLPADERDCDTPVDLRSFLDKRVQGA